METQSEFLNVRHLKVIFDISVQDVNQVNQVNLRVDHVNKG